MHIKGSNHLKEAVPITHCDCCTSNSAPAGHLDGPSCVCRRAVCHASNVAQPGVHAAEQDAGRADRLGAPPAPPPTCASTPPLPILVPLTGPEERPLLAPRGRDGPWCPSRLRFSRTLWLPGHLNDSLIQARLNFLIQTCQRSASPHTLVPSPLIPASPPSFPAPPV